MDAQEMVYDRALAEIKNGKKQSHWMWYVFPQIKGLGFSETSKFYSIENILEAQTYLNHPLLGPRLISVCNALLVLTENNATHVMGNPDDIKLQSSMTLFDAVENSNPVFETVLKKFFNGKKDDNTLKILAKDNDRLS